jgi:transcriptional regulator with XRE-family HTH domain
MLNKKNPPQAYKFRVGSNIRKWRNIKEIKQKELANMLKLSEASVSNIENDITNITLSQLEEISIALNVSIEQLLSDPQEKFRTTNTTGAFTPSKDSLRYLENELVKAMIASMEKKDQQLQEIMQQFIQTLNVLMKGEKYYSLTTDSQQHMLNEGQPGW